MRHGGEVAGADRDTCAQATISVDTLRDYIAYARSQCKPKLSEEAATTLIDGYVDMRRQGVSRKVGALRATCADEEWQDGPGEVTQLPPSSLDDGPSAGSLSDTIACLMMADPSNLHAEACKQTLPVYRAWGWARLRQLCPEQTSQRHRVYAQVITATPRQLESSVRLAEALAKMRLSPTVEREDVMEGLRLMKVGS